MNMEELVARSALADPAEVRRRLPALYVLTKLQIEDLNIDPSGKITCRCPFHDDTRPSFAVFGDEVERVGCWSCGWRGDVVDLVQAIMGVTLPQALRQCEELIRLKESEGWEPPEELRQVAPLDHEALRRYCLGALERARGPGQESIARLLELKGLRIPVSYLVDEWHVGADLDGYGDWRCIVIPHLDWNATLTGAKLRVGGYKPYSVPGSAFRQLYGAWRDTEAGTVVLTEGETDAWTTAYTLGTLTEWDVDVFSLPGASYVGTGNDMARLQGRKVILGFDHDAAGNAAVVRWMESLRSGNNSVAPFPWSADEEGLDFSALDRKRLIEGLVLARDVLQ